MANKKMPTFATEAEEAEWYFEHQDELEAYMAVPTAKDQATFRKELQSLTPKKDAIAAAKAAQQAYESRRPKTKQVPIRIAETDLDRAKALAGKKGIGYQTLIKMALHEWLDQQERSGIAG
jgi:predicted DNA binding CopG/RHH family protein